MCMHEQKYQWSGILRLLFAVFRDKSFLPFLFLLVVFSQAGGWTSVHAFTAIELEGQQIGRSVFLSPSDKSLWVSEQANHSSGSFYFTGTNTFPYDNSTGASNDWSWAGGYNGNFGGATGADDFSVDLDDMGVFGSPADDIYFCWTSILQGSFHSLFSDGFPDLCLHFVKVSGQYELAGSVSPFFDGTTRISTIHFPAITGLYVSSTTNMYWNIDYVSGSPTPEKVCLDRINLTTFQQLLPMCDDIISSGFLNFATSTTGTANSLYKWRLFISGPNNSIIADSGWSYYSHGQPYSPYDPANYPQEFGTTTFPIATTSPVSALTLECDPSDAFFSRSICNLAMLLFSPSPNSIAQMSEAIDNLQSRVPFSTVLEFKNAYASASRVASSSPPSLSLSLLGATSTILSEQNLNDIGLSTTGTSGVLQTLRYLIVIAMWLGFAWFCFMRITKIF